MQQSTGALVTKPATNQYAGARGMIHLPVTCLRVSWIKGRWIGGQLKTCATTLGVFKVVKSSLTTNTLFSRRSVFVFPVLTFCCETSKGPHGGTLCSRSTKQEGELGSIRAIKRGHFTNFTQEDRFISHEEMKTVVKRLLWLWRFSAWTRGYGVGRYGHLQYQAQEGLMEKVLLFALLDT